VIDITMVNVQVQTMEAQQPDGTVMRALKFTDPESKISVTVPMDLLTADRMGRALQGLVIAVPEPRLPR
jgi:hypothetical protein